MVRPEIPSLLAIPHGMFLFIITVGINIPPLPPEQMKC